MSVLTASGKSSRARPTFAAVTKEFPESIWPVRIRAEPDDGVAPARAAGPTAARRESSAGSPSKTTGWPGVWPYA